MTEATAESKSVVENSRKENYVTGRTASGNKSLNSGDDIAKALEGLTLDQVYEVSDKILKVEENLRAKYADRNPGMQRMIVGNRIRAAVKSEKDGTPTLKDLQAVTGPMQKANAKALEDVKKAKEAERKAKAEAKKKEAEAKKAAKKESEEVAA